jgi:mitogen-activated protein kinase 1/3
MENYGAKSRFLAGGVEFIIDSNYEFQKLISHSSQAITIKAKDKHRTRTVTITKYINIFDDLQHTRDLIKSIKLQRFCNSDHVEIIESILLPESRTGYNDLYIVKEFCETNLHCALYSKFIFTTQHVQYYMYLMLRGLNYIHSASIIHYDLKPANLLLNSSSDLKITGFDSAKASHHDLANFPEYIIAKWYRAPEVLYPQGKLMYENDIWSAGCILAEILSKKPLFSVGDIMSTYRRYVEVLGTPSEHDMEYLHISVKEFIRALPRYERIDWTTLFPDAHSDVIDLLDKMLRFHPKDRLKAEECMKHPFFVELFDGDEMDGFRGEVDWSFENARSREDYERLIYEEALCYSD